MYTMYTMYVKHLWRWKNIISENENFTDESGYKKKTVSRERKIEKIIINHTYIIILLSKVFSQKARSTARDWN